MEILPFHSSPNTYERSLNNLDIDVTYYVGSHWEVPSDSLIPLRDIPTLDYNSENKITSRPGALAYALKHNLSLLIQFCSSLRHQIHQGSFKANPNGRSISWNVLHNNSMTK